MAEAKNKSVFDTLNAINVNKFTETKDTGNAKLTYLSWTWAWTEVKKRYPDATYEIIKFNGIPYVYDPLTGFMVYTTVTIGGLTHEMWLPVMDGQNRAMKAEAYQVQTKYKTITVNAATMFDINKTIMRCLVKNLAMFGLGLYIYAGEDLPTVDDAVVDQDQAQAVPNNAPVAPFNAQTQTVQHFTCSVCNNDFTDVKAATATFKKFGKYACPDCIKRKTAEAKAKKAEETKKKLAEFAANNELPFEIV